MTDNDTDGLFLDSPQEIPSGREKDIVSVAQFLERANKLLSAMTQTRVHGEIAEVSVRDRYAFFRLKDISGKDCSIECFIGWQRYDRFGHLLQDGLEVVISGEPGIYKTGRFRIDVTEIEPIGEGALRRAFEALKKKLDEKGFFATERKRPVPEIVENIGLITSESGAAIHDFVTNLGNYGFRIFFLDVFVEGDYADASITEALVNLGRRSDLLDVIVLIRGGGSMESLKAFNSESVAEAIFASRVPVITGVGHEKDETIADYVADIRCSTPTAVAALLRNNRQALLQKIDDHADYAVSAMEEILESYRSRIEQAVTAITTEVDALLDFCATEMGRLTNLIEARYQKIFRVFDDIQSGFIRVLGRQWERMRQDSHAVRTASGEVLHNFELLLMRFQKRLDTGQATLVSLNPEAILRRGYSITSDENNHVLKRAVDVQPASRVRIKLSEGQLSAKVERITDKGRADDQG